jgi:hypothetical protein
MSIREYDPSAGDFLQGDVCIFPLPAELDLSTTAIEIAPVAGRLILQEGEVTGHHHAIALERVRHFRPEAQLVGDPTVAMRSPRLRRAFGGKKAPDVGTARLYRDGAAIEALRACGELTRTDLAIGILVVEGGPVMLSHEEHDGIRIPPGKYYVGGQVESAGAEDRRVVD